ncbi:MAG: hypothetical protein LBM38_01665 [Clostridiales bacterium]|nr:hypothetical protein [Clostridiales bacterium]
MVKFYSRGAIATAREGPGFALGYDTRHYYNIDIKKDLWYIRIMIVIN